MGIDPGLSGGIAFLCPSTRALLAVHPMPTMEAGGKRLVNGAMLRETLLKHMPTSACVEAVGARPGQGVTSMFSFGRGLGTVEGVLAALHVPVFYLGPQTWRGRVKLRGGKGDARGLATRTWPSHAAHFARVMDDGKAEAALIALAGSMGR